MPDNIRVFVKDGKYYMECDLSDEPVYLCKVTELNSLFIDDVAKCAYMRLEGMRRIKEWEASITS